MTSLRLLAHLYESTGRAVVVNTALALVKLFKRLYVLNLWMEVVHIVLGAKPNSGELRCPATVLIAF